MIQTSTYQAAIERVLEEEGLYGCLLEFVDSVQVWAESVALPEWNPDRVAMAVTTPDGRPLIVIKAEITDDNRSAVIDRLIFGGFDEELSRIQSPGAFLEHLVLHEAAHHLLPDGTDEDECDRWAFEHLGSRIQ